MAETDEKQEVKIPCEKVIATNDGNDNQGRPVMIHHKCGAPAAERTIKGLLTSAKAILCDAHARQAEREAFVSANGYPMGKIDKRVKGKYQQRRFGE